VAGRIIMARMLNRRLTVACALALVFAATEVPAAGQAPLTRAERTGYQETSRYADVLAFLAGIQPSPVLHVRTFGYSFEGRPLPLVVVGRGLESGSAEEVAATGRLRVLVFANIHGGEVEGKEAAQMLLRSFAAGDHDRWLDSLVVLVAPLYNADGNERVAVTNRYRQNGPAGGVGERANAQGLDLNRDHMKLATPEARALVGVLRAFDPHVVLDLHTTNGTHHAYHLTYSPPLHPDTEGAITSFLRERWLPALTERFAHERGWDLYYYGNAYAPPGMERGWYTFDHRPRFSTNYVGLRNRFAILSEAYSYVDFRGRVETTLAFVEAILDFAHAHASTIGETVRLADAADLAGGRMGVRAAFNRDGVREILMGAAEERLSPVSGRRYLARLDVAWPEAMPEYGTFRVTEWERVPDEYYVPAELTRVLDLLELHGITVVRLEEPRTQQLERFAIDSVSVAPQEFQGHREMEVHGRWESVLATLPAGTVVVPVAGQRLGRLVFHLLEPRADDGMVNWNVLAPQLHDQPPYHPVLRRTPPG
jgi:hypothetical protein